MKKFIRNILLFSIAFFVVEKVFYVFLYVSPKMEVDKRLEYVINGGINKDLIVLGSSRGARNIIAHQIEDSLNITAYNLSYPGSNIEFHEFLLRSLIKFNKNPKIVLLAVDDPSELLPSNSINFRLERLYPLSKYNYINDELIKREEKSLLSKILILARINKSNFDIRQKHFTTLDSLQECGSMPISFQRENHEFDFPDEVKSYISDDELPAKVNAFKNFQDLCIANDIRLYIVYSPNFKNFRKSFQRRIEELSHSSVCSMIYDTTNLIYKNKDFYYDMSHLKTNGAIIFTNEIIDQLKNSDNSDNNICQPKIILNR